jgi:hypothetical protein
MRRSRNKVPPGRLPQRCETGQNGRPSTTAMKKLNLRALVSFTARTAVTIFFTSDADLLLDVGAVFGRLVDGERRVSTFPSGALAAYCDLLLDAGFGGSFDVVAVRRREDADGNRNSGVKVQVDDSSRRELFSNAFRVSERKTRRDLLLLERKRFKEESVW